MNYHKHFIKVIDYIGKHIDDDLSLDNLSATFFISKFHFHRLFTAFTGLSLQQYIRWLRLKRAAHQLMFDKDLSIIQIAINAGFDSHEAFTRAFKKTCGLSPSEARRVYNFAYWEKLPYCLQKRGNIEMNVEIKIVNPIRLAVVEHRGDPQKMSQSLNKLMTWISNQSINLKLKAGNAFAVAYNDPKATPAPDFKIDFGIKIPESLKVEGDVVERYIPSGRYAVVMHKGSRDDIGDTIYKMYREWLPKSGLELGDFPCVFCYHNFDHEVVETESLTECWFLLK